VAESITISNQAPSQLAVDYAALRKAGLAYIEQFASGLWTDYNTHDPGITVLEMLCYAITDLGLRTSLPTKDLLASSAGSLAALYKAFPAAETVLPTCPISELDYRKLFIDVDGVRNAWLEQASPTIHVNCRETADPNPAKRQQLRYLPLPASVPLANQTQFALRGLLNLKLDLDDFFIAEQIRAAAGNALTYLEVQQQIMAAVRQAYLANRHLCEDLHQVLPVPVQHLLFCADVDLMPEAKVSDVYAQILLVVQQYLNPAVKRYSLAEMRAKTNPDGNPLSIDQIFEGPLLKNGFIVDQELLATSLRQVVYASDLINLLMGIPGVRAVKKVRLNTLVPNLGKPCGEWATSTPEGERWCLHIATGHQPQLCVDKAALAFYKDIIPVGSLTDKARAIQQLIGLQREAYEANRKQIDPLPLPAGEVHDLAAYQSISQEFPDNYGIGRRGLGPSATPARQAQAKQLKAYLLFFDQLLANYLAQLANVQQLFGTQPADIADPRTYFSQVVAGLEGAGELYVDHANLPTALADLGRQLEGYDLNPERKNRLLDHLLARFAENFNEYALLMHTLFGERNGQEILQDKADFLNEYHQTCRATAYHYGQPAWNNDNVAGVTRRVARLAGINDYRAHAATAQTVMRVFPSEEGAPPKFKFRLHELEADTLKRVFTTSTRIFDTEAAAKTAMRRAFLPVPARERFEVYPVSGGFKHVLRDAKDNTVARTPAKFATKKAAWADIDALLATLIYGGESLFLVEHLLLRPEPGQTDEGWLAACTEPDCDHCKPLDPYSFRVSVILPGYTTRFANVDFRRYVEKLIRSELPAHVLARICWVSRPHLRNFEVKYRAWLAAKLQATVGNKAPAYGLALNELIIALETLHTVYPAGVLHDCENENEEQPIVLGRSTLGSLPETP